MNNKLYYKSVLAGLSVRDSCNFLFFFFSSPPAVGLLSFVHLKQDILQHRHHSLWPSLSFSYAIWLMTLLLDLVQQAEAILLTVLKQLIPCEVMEL